MIWFNSLAYNLGPSLDFLNGISSLIFRLTSLMTFFHLFSWFLHIFNSVFVPGADLIGKHQSPKTFPKTQLGFCRWEILPLIIWSFHTIGPWSVCTIWMLELHGYYGYYCVFALFFACCSITCTQWPTFHSLHHPNPLLWDLQSWWGCQWLWKQKLQKKEMKSFCSRAYPGHQISTHWLLSFLF